MKGQLDVSYNRYCLVCGFARLHRSNTGEYCTQCKQTKGDAECLRILKSKEGTLRKIWDPALNRVIEVPYNSHQLEVKKETQVTEVVQEYKDWVEEMEVENSMKEEVALYAGGKIASSKCPAFHLIPTISLLRLVERFELGQKRKGDKAWNATTDQSVLLDKEWVLERLNHVVKHALDLRDKISRNDIEAIKEEDDSAAIMWAGAFLIAATDALMRKKENEDWSNADNWSNPSPQKETH